MFFTKEDIQKIKKAIFEQGVKDTDFQDADDLTSEEYIVVVQDGQNKKVKVSDIIDVIRNVLVIPEVKRFPEGTSINDAALSYASGDLITSLVKHHVEDCCRVILDRAFNDYIIDRLLGIIKANNLTNEDYLDEDTWHHYYALEQLTSQDIQNIINYFPK